MLIAYTQWCQSGPKSVGAKKGRRGIWGTNFHTKYLLVAGQKNYGGKLVMGRVPENPKTREPDPTRGFFTNPNPTRTRKKYYKPDPTRTRNIANPTRKPEKTRIYKKYVFLSKYT